MSVLRSRRIVGGSNESTEKVEPLDTTEQDRIIREFEIDKLKQDRLWKHFLSVLYAFASLLVACILSCSLLFGCNRRASSPLEGPRCTYFVLPTILFELVASDTPTIGLMSTSMIVNSMIGLCLLLLIVWAYYAWRMNEASVKQAFIAAKTSVTNQNQPAGAPSSSSSSASLLHSIPALQISRRDWDHLRSLRRIATAGFVVWLLITTAILFTRGSQVGLISGLFLFGPIGLIGLTKLAAKWSQDLETQIDELKSSKYTYHDL